MKKGSVYWITGLSGAGKTTIGNLLFEDMRKSKNNVVFLDGDVLRDVYQDSAYGVEDRKRLAFQHARLCKMLADQGIDVIICVIAMFDECRKWNRDNIENYKEIYLYVNMTELIRRDQKKLYSRALRKEISDVMGIDIAFEEPKCPDLVVDNSGQYTPQQVLKKIKISLTKKEENMTANYRSYWNHFYRGGGIISEPSSFAIDMLQFMEPGKSLLDIGCGNGRDSIYFYEKRLNVTGLDYSEDAINQLNDKYGNAQGLRFICSDFAKTNLFIDSKFDYCYSRFFIHAITEEQENLLLKQVYTGLKKSGKFFIEVRSIKDELFGCGKPAGRNAFIYNDHYRRFIVKDEIEENLEENGFEILYIEENQGFAVFENYDPYIIRIVAEKK